MPESPGIATESHGIADSGFRRSKLAHAYCVAGRCRLALARFRCDSGDSGDLFRFFLQCGEQLVIHAPAFENLDGCSDAETGTHQRSEDASGFLVVDGLVEPLASQEGPR